MPAMTKLPADSFWPKGAPESIEIPVPIPKLTSDTSTSIISPLTLPRGVAGYFDRLVSNDVTPTRLAPISQQSRASQVYSPLSPGLKGPAPHRSSFFSPQLLASTKNTPCRSSSLPPEARNDVTSPGSLDNRFPPRQEMAIHTTNNTLSPAVNGAGNFASSGCPRSISADPVAPTCHDQLVQRLLRQRARTLEAWEAERKYLEANRERAEEVYKEERALMEEERAQWEEEKAILLAEIERLGGVNPFASNGGRILPQVFPADHGHCGCSKGCSRVSPDNSQPTVQNGGATLTNGSSPLPALRGRAPDLASPRSPNGPSKPTTDFLKPIQESDAEAGPVPIVDVKEIDPQLEGIRIKATSVKKPTFTDIVSRDGSSTSVSPPSGSDQPKSPQAKKEQTLQVLAANESDRLTMHAGHTPNHSLSSIATVASSGTATATSNGGDSTPTTTLPHEDDASSRGTAAGATGGTALELAGDMDNQPPPASDDPEPVLEPSDDRELTGPLMVRNMPAHDEVFFQKLTDKLEQVSKDDVAALPAVLKEDDSGVLPGENAPECSKNQPGSGSGSGSGSNKSSPKSTDADEEHDELGDIPLKLRKPLNFGRPFGELR
ncbi:hypothetical protein VTI28DRAFT_1271 [Corynascus sepedonium]